MKYNLITASLEPSQRLSLALLFHGLISHLLGWEEALHSILNNEIMMITRGVGRGKERQPEQKVQNPQLLLLLGGDPLTTSQHHLLLLYS